MMFNDDKNDFFDGPDIQDEPKKSNAPKLKPEDPDYWEETESEFEHLRPRKKTGFWIMIAACGVAIGILIAMYVYFFTPYVSEATQYGYVDDIQHRGDVFKTYEGVLIPYKEKNDTTRIYPGDILFSVKNPKVAVTLKRLQYAGLPARVEYKRYRVSLPWRGETKMLVVNADTADPAKILPPEFTPDTPYVHIHKALREKEESAPKQ